MGRTLLWIGGAFFALVVLGGIINAVQDIPSRVGPAPPKSEADEAVEQCQAAIATTYGLYSIRRGPTENDKWRDHGGAGGYDSLWTIDGKNDFGASVENVVECEAGKKVKGAWGLPFLWNVTLHDDRMDPGTLDHPLHRAHRRRSKAATPRPTPESE